MKRGFTLIELLIVVAIIAILAAIAVPNFLEAQMRTKISRVQADQRSMATALESYAVDNVLYPAYGNPADYNGPSGESVIFVPISLTTPIGYMSALPVDVFPGTRPGMAPLQTSPYFYRHNYDAFYLDKVMHGHHVEEHYRSLTGANRAVMWHIWSFGPDLDDDHGVLIYDPTNGSVSSGDMMRFGP